MLMGVTNTKYAFRQHLNCIGFVMDQPPQLVMQKFIRHMGPQRHAQYQQIMAAAHQGEEQQNRIYDFMQDLREANLLRCLSPDVTLDTSYYLYEKVLPHLASGSRGEGRVRPDSSVAPQRHRGSEMPDEWVAPGNPR